MAMVLLPWIQNTTQRRFFIEFMLHPPFTQISQITGSITSTTTACPPEAEVANFNGNGGTDMSAEVRRMCNEGRFREALQIFHVMDEQGIRPDDSTYPSLLDACIQRKALAEGKLLHALVIDTGFSEDIFLQTKLVIMYAKCGMLEDARQFLDKMPKRNVVSWTAMIAAYTRQGHNEEALRLYYQMQREGIRPNTFTFTSVLPACANLLDLKHGKEVHEDIIRGGFQSEVFVGSALVDMYAKCGRFDDARQVFDKIPERNVVLWNALIAGYALSGRVDEGMKLFGMMPERDLVSWTAMIAGYAKNGQPVEALKLFQKMPERDLVSWNAVIAGYAQNGHADEALGFFQKMSQRNAVSWTAMIAGYAQGGRVDEAMKLFQKMSEQDAVSWTAIIAGYAQNGQVNEALRLFRRMPERRAVAWNVMIAGYAEDGQFNEALNLFRQMQLTGVKPDSVTFTSVLPTCANLAALINGKEVHENIIRSGFQFHVSVGNALVDMYAKCGAIKDAYRVFDKMLERDTISWNTMIAGYAMHGCGEKALQLFEEMQHSGTKVDYVTFIGVLNACSHSGLVDVGWQYFDRMNRDYHITPSAEHYCCMVDLLGRAGRLDEAHNLIYKMPIEPDAAVWGSLLGACKVYANAKLGELVAEHLFELDPENTACYVLLSNIYATAGRWNDVEKVRQLMKDRRVEKNPGCSWIEINSKMHAFLGRER